MRRGSRIRVDGWARTSLLGLSGTAIIGYGWFPASATDHGIRQSFTTQYPQDAQEQVDDVHVQGRRAVDGVVQGLRNPVGAPPVVADVAAEDHHHDPVENAVTGAENEYFH